MKLKCEINGQKCRLAGFTIISLVFILTFFKLSAIAQVHLEEIVVPEVQADQQAEIILRGDNLNLIRRVEKVRFDGKELPILDTLFTSEKEISIFVKIPGDAEPGSHKISVLVADQNSLVWFGTGGKARLTNQPLKVFYNGQQVRKNEPPRIDFLQTSGHQPVSKLLLVYNTGKEPVSNLTMNLPAGLELITSFPNVIAPGDSFQIQLRYKDQIPENIPEATFTLLPEEPGGVALIVPFKPQIKQIPFPSVQIKVDSTMLSPDQLAAVVFDSVSVGETPEKTVFINNQGSIPIEVRDIHLDNGFTLLSRLPDSILPGVTDSFKLGVTAVEPVIFAGNLSFEILDSLPHLFKFPVSVQVSKQLPAVSEIPETDTEHEFLPVQKPEIVLYDLNTEEQINALQPIKFSHAGEEKSFAIGHTHSNPLTINRISLPAGFSTTTSIPLIIPVGETAILVIKQDDAEEELESGNIRIYSTFDSVAHAEYIIMPASLASPRNFPWVVILLGGGVIGAGIFWGIRSGKSKLHKGSSKMVRPEFTVDIQIDPGLPVLKMINNSQYLNEWRFEEKIDAGVQVMNQTTLLVNSEVAVDVAQETRVGVSDNLERIEGIGPKIAQLLNEKGVFSYRQLAETSPERLQQILNNAQLWMTTAESWPEQARLASSGKWDELDSLQENLIGGRHPLKNK